MSCLLSLVFSDPGLDLFLRGLYVSPDWRAGATMGTILATINDYFADMQTFVDATFVKRLAEGLLEELVKRMLHTMVANVQSSSPAINTAFVHRLEADEVAVSQAFCAMPGLKPERVVKYLQQLQDLRELMSADSLESFVLCYSNMLEVVSLPPEVLQKVVAQRPDMSRSDAAEVISQCKEIYKQRAKRDAAAKPVEKPLTFMQRVFASATTSAPPAPAAPTAAPPKTPANGLS